MNGTRSRGVAKGRPRTRSVFAALAGFASAAVPLGGIAVQIGASAVPVTLAALAASTAVTQAIINLIKLKKPRAAKEHGSD